MSNETGTFWDHLDELRHCILKALAAIVVFAVAAFAFKQPLFDVVLAPTHSDFVTYRLIGAPDFHLSLMNTGLTEQFMIHVKLSLYGFWWLRLISSTCSSALWHRHSTTTNGATP